jgi:hypothetical protein
MPGGYYRNSLAFFMTVVGEDLSLHFINISIYLQKKSRHLPALL